MKKYFKNMDIEYKLNIVMNIEELKEKEAESYYEQLMEQQLEEANLMLGKNYQKYIEVRDNYSSFYMRLIDWHKFLDNLDSDYLCNEGIKLYNEIKTLNEEYENIEQFSDRYNELDDILEEKSKDLLKICENQLHEYETFTDDDLKEQFRFDFEENNYLDDLYIIDDDTTKVYEDISYTKIYK